MAKGDGKGNRIQKTAAAVAVSNRVRTLRVAAGMTQEELAKAIGVTYQQMHKYERGINRITVDGLYAIAAGLGVSPCDLLSDATATDGPALKQVGRYPHLDLELAREFASLAPGLKAIVISLIRDLAKHTT